MSSTFPLPFPPTLEQTIRGHPIKLWEQFFFLPIPIPPRKFDLVGSILFSRFAETYLGWEEMSDCPPLGTTFNYYGTIIEVITRELEEDRTIAPSFELFVSEERLQEYRDLFLLAGSCPRTGYGYLLGWSTWEEISAQPLRTDLRHAAKGVPLRALHPIQFLADYLRRP